jgi:hypothetical protein
MFNRLLSAWPVVGIVRAALSATAALLIAATASAQLKIVSYNTTGPPEAGFDSIFKAIGEEVKSVTRGTIDVLLLQEQSHAAGLPHTQAFVNLLNTLYAGQGITYARGNLIGGSATPNDSTQAIIYKTNTVHLFPEEVAIGVADSDGIERQPLRYKLKPVGYDDSAAFYAYNSHYKASMGSANIAQRLVEAQAIRADADALGQGARIIYAGDFNFYDYNSPNSSAETAWGALTAAGPGQAVDPIGKVGTWHDNAAFQDIHTQAPGGAMDDRFDFQLTTAEVTSGEGFSYINGTYRAFGNNGTTFNTTINNASNTYPFDMVSFDATHTRAQLLNYMANVTDHLPVVADYRLPAKMGVQVASIPSTVNMGAIVPITVSVDNTAPVTSSQFADELDYTINVTGSLTGGNFTDINPAASGPHFHDIFLDTSTAGLKTGTLTVMATSDQASSPLFTMPISFTVLAPTFLAADFNNDGQVNAGDLQMWRTNFGIGSGAAKSHGDADADGDVDGADFAVWQQQLGQPQPSLATSGAVPEPMTAAMILPLLATLAAVNRRRRGHLAPGQ